MSLSWAAEPTAKRKQACKTARSFCSILQTLELQAGPTADRSWLRTFYPYSFEGYVILGETQHCVVCDS